MLRYQYPYKSGFRVTCPFGRLGDWQAGFHIGADLVGTRSKKIYPIAAGTVESINAHGAAYGNHICVRHADGNVSLYAHLSGVSVTSGQIVTTDTVLGVEGSTGNSSGSHLHLEIHKSAYKYPAHKTMPAACDWLIDPIAFLRDVDHWAYDEYLWLNNTAKVGVSERRFDEPITRGEVIALLARAVRQHI